MRGTLGRTGIEAPPPGACQVSKSLILVLAIVLSGCAAHRDPKLLPDNCYFGAPDDENHYPIVCFEERAK